MAATTTTPVEPLRLRSAQDPAPPARPPIRHPAVLLLAPVALALGAVGFAQAADGGIHLADVVRIGLIAAWTLAGLVLAVRRPLEHLGTLLLGGAVLAGACSATASDSTLADIAHPIVLGLLPAAMLHLLLALPTGSLGTVARRRGAATGYGIGLAVGVGLALADGPPPFWPLWVEGLTLVACGIPAANARYKSVAGQARQRLQWVGLAVAVVVEAVLVILALRLFLSWPEMATEVAAASTVLIPLSLAAGASNRLVARVDRLLVATVSLAGLTGVVLAVYLVIVLGLGRVPEDEERRLLVLSMLAAGIASLLYVPTRDRLTETANRLVYGEREPPDEVLRTFGSRLTRAIPMDELLLQLAESLRKTMALQAAEIWTGSDGTYERAVSVPDRGPAILEVGETERPVVTRAGVTGNAWLTVWLPALLAGREGAQVRAAPVTHSGELLGLIVAQRPGDGDAFAEEDERVMTELARQVGLALHNVQLDSALQASLDEVKRQAEELRQSRARIVATADAERRRIERNLHDGAQQHLVALAVNLRLARDMVGDDPETAGMLLDELAGSVKETVQELRDLAHGIYPPLLMDSGLTEALRAAAGRSPLQVLVDAEGIGRYPTEVEAAVYFCCLEALQNAAKHAPEATVTVTLRQVDDELRFEVADDGPGFDAAARGRGHGFDNMNDRVGAQGGSIDWDSAPGEGTRISGMIPVPEPAAAS